MRIIVIRHGESEGDILNVHEGFVWVDFNELVNNMYLEMQSWALEQCMKKIFGCGTGV